MIVAVPAAIAVTRPFADTVAIDGALDAHVTTRPPRVFPLASFVIAVIVAVAPTKRFALVGTVTTDATRTSETVMVAVALFPSLVAVMIALPADTAATVPLASTVATPGVFDIQVMKRPLSAIPFASFRTAVMVVADPTTRLAVVGVSVTVATGASETATVALALIPSLVAVIVALPAPTAVTTPLADTVAIDGALDVHVTTRPDNTVPVASEVTAEIVVVMPTTRVALVGVTTTDATGTAETVTVLLPLCPSLVAVIVALPGATAVTMPLPDTVAICGALEAQVTTRPESVAPLASRTVAENVAVPPITMLAVGGLTTTEPTGVGVAGVTTTCAMPLFPSAVARIVVVPGRTAVTRPSVLIVAIVVSADVHVIGRPPSTFPCESVGTAVNEPDWPTTNAAEPGTIAIEAIDITVTVIVADAVFPSLVAVSVAVPAETPTTVPVASTLAICAELLAQATGRPVRTWPLPSYATARRTVVPPATIVAFGGTTDMVAIGAACTVTTALADWPPELAAT